MEKLVNQNFAASDEKINNVQEFNKIKDWLECNYFFTKIDLSDEAWKPILYFSLIWNIFESKACNFEANEESLGKSVTKNSSNLDVAKYKPIFDWFQKRYFPSRQLDARFDNLFRSKSKPAKISNPKMRAHLEGILKKDEENISADEMVLGLLFIAYRIRNNFFHGNKDINDLLSQTELFHQINQLLLNYTGDILILE
jgi:hypothetical protein